MVLAILCRKCGAYGTAKCSLPGCPLPSLVTIASEPTLAMVKAGRDAIRHLPMERNGLQVALRVWRAMMEKACKQ